jgi:type IX secretion system PorP/SprF family membrane protein
LYLLNNIKDNRFSILILLILFRFGEVKCQDFHFTQFFANKLFLAPSFAGATAQNRFITNYRNQWPGLPKGYSTYSVSFDHFFSHFNSGAGVIVMRDVAGSGKLGALHLGLYYSYDFNINRTIHLRPGISFNYLQRSVDFTKFRFSDQYVNDDYQPTTEVLNNDNTGAVDASSSIIIYSSKITLGVTLDHMLQPNISLINSTEKYPMKLSLYGVATILRKGRLLKPIDETLSLAFLFKNSSEYRQLDIGVYWAQSPLTFGLWYRGIPVLNSDRGDSFAGLIGYKNPNFSIGYSYDFTISNLINKTSGAHEISMAIEFMKYKKRRKMHAVPCPEF